MYDPNRYDERKVDSTKIKKDCGCRREDGVCSLLIDIKCTGKEEPHMELTGRQIRISVRNLVEFVLRSGILITGARRVHRKRRC